MSFAFSSLAYSIVIAGLFASELSSTDGVVRKLADEVVQALHEENIEFEPINARLASLSVDENLSLPSSFALYIPARARRNVPAGMLDREESVFCGMVVFRSAQPVGFRGEMALLSDLPDGSLLAGCEVAKVFLHRTASRRCSLEIIGVRKQPIFQADAHPLGQRTMNLLEFEDQVLAIQLDSSLVAFVPIARRIQGEERK